MNKFIGTNRFMAVKRHLRAALGEGIEPEVKGPLGALTTSLICRIYVQAFRIYVQKLNLCAKPCCSKGFYK
jgi:hypothetical protein